MKKLAGICQYHVLSLTGCLVRKTKQQGLMGMKDISLEVTQQNFTATSSNVTMS